MQVSTGVGEGTKVSTDWGQALGQRACAHLKLCWEEGTRTLNDLWEHPMALPGTGSTRSKEREGSRKEIFQCISAWPVHQQT